MDLANRQSRLNVQIFGLKEKSENKVKLQEHVKQFFSEALWVNFADSELQMVHWSLTKMLAEGGPPHPVIIRFHSFLEKQRV